MKNLIGIYDFLNEEGGSVSTSGGVSGGGGTAYSNLGNTGGMGSVKAPQPGGGEKGSVSTSFSDSQAGSGDLPAKNSNIKVKRFNDVKKAGQDDEKESKKSKKSKKSKSSKKSNETIYTDDEKSRMYVTKFTDWKNYGEESFKMKNNK